MLKASVFRRQPFGTLSQVTKDVRQVSSLEGPSSGFDSLDRNRGLYAYKLTDYDTSQADAAANLEALALPITHELDGSYSRDHPLTEAALKSRRQADVYRNLKPNQILVTNLPAELEPWMTTPAKLREHLLKTVHKDLEVTDIRYVHSVTSAAQGIKYAYIVISMGSKRQAHLVEKSLRQIWVGDQKLKVKSEKDAKTESFDHRTVIIRDIPTHINQRQILAAFAPEAGAVVGIELPMENVAISDYVEKRAAESPLTPENQDRARKFKLAQLAVKQSLELDQQHQDAIAKELGVDAAKSILAGDLSQAQDVIDKERQMALIRIVTRLQAEGAQVINKKRKMVEIRDEFSSHSSVASAESLKDKIAANRGAIQEVMHFLKKNDVSAPAVVNSSLDKLLELGQGELAHAYDTLVDALEKREKEIESRIGKQLQHFGIEERIIFEKRDYKFELEDLPNEEMYRAFPEEVISVQDQINYILQKKNWSAEEKFSQIVNNNLNPFLKPLWNKTQLRFADESENFPKQMELFDVYDKSMSVMRMMRTGSRFTREAEKKIHEMVDEYKDDYTVAFDELYHREKDLVAAVIAADKALKAKQATFDSLALKFALTKNEITQLTRDSLLSEDHQDLFEKGAERMEARVLKNSLMGEVANGYEFQISKINKLKQMVDSGELSQSQYDTLIQVAREQEMRNKGYCFLTFSHSDEARLLVLQNQNCHLDGRKIQLDVKANLDHGDMDLDFLFSRLKNDERVTKEIIQLRQARKELREFESQIDDQLPNRRKLKEFRALARNVIAGTSHTDNKVVNGRSDLDEEKLRAKIKEFEKKYPHVDLSQLFNTEKAEDARRSLHKNAFASYKAREFLKQGINQEKEQVEARLSDAKRRLKEHDPFNFPELDETVQKVLSKDVMQPRIIDHGEQITKPGRRFNGYTDQEFIEAYFGKDMMRNHVVDRAHDPLFLEQKSLKEMYPVSRYLKMPEENWKLQQIEELGWLPSAEHFDPESKAVYSSNPELAQLQKRMEVPYNEGDLIQNFAHPEDKNRNLLDDLEKTLQAYEKKKREQIDEEGVNAYDMKEITKIRNHYMDQYKIDPKKPKKSWMYELKHGRYTDSLIVDKAADEREEGVVDETQDAKFQTDYDSTMDNHTKRVNAEYLYNLRENPKLENEFDYSKEFKKLAEDQNKSFAELAEEQLKKAHYSKAGHKYGGKWFQQHEASLETPREATKASGPGRTLESFVDQEEDDIYEMYQKQVNQRPQEEVPVPEPKLNQDLFAPDLPRFEEFMNDKAQGIHPFDKITDKVNESLKSMPGLTEAEINEDRELHQRELLGRLMGEKLTPRQFELLTGQFRSQDAKLQHVKDNQNNRLFDKQQWIGLAQDHAEKVRRRKVMSGEWTEAESRERLDEAIKELYANNPGPYQQEKILRDFYAVIDAVQRLDNPERLLEKEYYFDETLGESLNEHCEALKAQYPSMKVQARRDRDGFAIVKTIYDNAYKYDLDKLEAWSPEQAQKDHNETLEAIWQAVLPESPQQVIDNVASQLEHTIPLIMGSSEPSYELDAFTKLRLQSLCKLRDEGRIETDEMVKQLFQISDEADYDTSKPLPKVNGTVFDSPMQVTHSEIIADRERFRAEIYEQLMKRVKKHMFMTKRTKGDYIKPRVSEERAFRGQVQSHENELAGLESQVSGVDETSENFDREAFKRMKNEIKMRKAAKERLLSQGHAQFKQYLRL